MLESIFFFSELKVHRGTKISIRVYCYCRLGTGGIERDEVVTRANGYLGSIAKQRTRIHMDVGNSRESDRDLVHRILRPSSASETRRAVDDDHLRRFRLSGPRRPQRAIGRHASTRRWRGKKLHESRTRDSASRRFTAAADYVILTCDVITPVCRFSNNKSVSTG